MPDETKARKRTSALRAVRIPCIVILCAGVIAGCGASDASEVGAVSDGSSASETVERVRTTGLDSLFVAQAVETAAELPRLRTLLVARHGEIEIERHFRGPGLHVPANVKSVSKSILSAIVGIAIEEGHLEGVDQPVAPFFAQYNGPDDDPRKQQITIGHLLTMQSGLERTSGGNYGRWVSSRNWVQYAFTRPMVADPGGARIYSTGNSHLLSAVLTEATGQSTWAYARNRLAEPLGITLPRWSTDPQGIFFGGNDMHITPRDLLRFGELYRNGGRMDGRQILPEWWVRESLTPRARLRRAGEGYGYGWFASRVRGYDVFYGQGYGGQFVFVIPELEMTIVVTSNPDAIREGSHNGAIRRLLADYVIPAAIVGRVHVVERLPARPASGVSPGVERTLRTN